MGVENLMETIVDALPEMSSRGRPTVREVCLSFDQDRWHALAGGHPSVHIGEWGGDFSAEGITAETALSLCLDAIRRHVRS